MRNRRRRLGAQLALLALDDDGQRHGDHLVVRVARDVRRLVLGVKVAQRIAQVVHHQLHARERARRRGGRRTGDHLRHLAEVGVVGDVHGRRRTRHAPILFVVRGLQRELPQLLRERRRAAGGRRRHRRLDQRLAADLEQRRDRAAGVDRLLELAVDPVAVLLDGLKHAQLVARRLGGHLRRLLLDDRLPVGGLLELLKVAQRLGVRQGGDVRLLVHGVARDVHRHGAHAEPRVVHDLGKRGALGWGQWRVTYTDAATESGG